MEKHSFKELNHMLRSSSYAFLMRNFQHDPLFVNQMHWTLSAVLASMARGLPNKYARLPAEELIKNALEKKKIRAIAEVGPSTNSLLTELATHATKCRELNSTQ